jgi:hypothetical protein
MNVSLSVDDEVVKTVSKIAIDKHTTLTAMIREYLERVAAEGGAHESRRGEREALERSFADFEFRKGSHSWKREALHERC